MLAWRTSSKPSTSSDVGVPQRSCRTTSSPGVTTIVERDSSSVTKVSSSAPADGGFRSAPRPAPIRSGVPIPPHVRESVPQNGVRARSAEHEVLALLLVGHRHRLEEIGVGHGGEQHHAPGGVEGTAGPEQRGEELGATVEQRRSVGRDGQPEVVAGHPAVGRRRLPGLQEHAGGP